ncbi:MAG: OmpA family protein [Candidatus Cloacimonetes bacterium]|nr:OmpA family protein [Candidatus Cloacimonadota bacterium]
MNIHRTTLLLLIMLLLSIGACSQNKHKVLNEERGMFSETLKIRTLPTKAKIFINEREIGESPLNYRISHEDSRMVNIKAVPLYPNQYTQNIFLMIPPIPRTMTIYMNHYPESYDRNEESEFVPPEKPAPEIIVETKVDTVYIENTLVETKTLIPPSIYFDTDSHTVKASEYDKLMLLVDMLVSNPATHLEILGFADYRASDKYNLELSLNRANAVKEFLIQKGIKTNRLTAVGQGKISSIKTEGMEMDLQENRKVLFILRDSTF